MANYTFHFTQSFEEVITIQANDEAEAEANLRSEWGSGELEIHSITEEEVNG